MRCIEKIFRDAKQNKRKVFIPFITCGDPNFEMTRKLCLTLEENGADIIELGVPFSDPLADGPIIQRASQRALNNGVTLKKICSFVKEIRQKTKIPIVLMGYYNSIFKPGINNSLAWMNEAGINGLICPDLPPEEAEELIFISGKNQIDTIFLIAPTSTLERIKYISQKTTGFIYYVSVTGVTGTRETLPFEVKEHITKIRNLTNLPIAVGFGISSPKQAAEIAKYSDGIIIGSAIIKILEKNDFSDLALTDISLFASKIRESLTDYS